MILCNLSNILEKRNMSIIELSKLTSISRISLSALANNKSSGINYETLDAICRSLQIKPNEFFLYLPISINSLSIKQVNDSIIADISFMISQLPSNRKMVFSFLLRLPVISLLPNFWIALYLKNCFINILKNRFLRKLMIL